MVNERMVGVEEGDCSRLGVFLSSADTKNGLAWLQLKGHR